MFGAKKFDTIQSKVERLEEKFNKMGEALVKTIEKHAEKDWKDDRLAVPIDYLKEAIQRVVRDRKIKICESLRAELTREEANAKAK